MVNPTLNSKPEEHDFMRSVLSAKMHKDAEFKTVGSYLHGLLTTLLHEEEGFDGKRPFGNSGWKTDLAYALIKGKILPGEIDSDGYVESYDRRKLDEILIKAVNKVFALAKKA